MVSALPGAARVTAEQEDLERFILEKIEGGAPLPGIYPANEQTLDEYAAWQSHRVTLTDS